MKRISIIIPVHNVERYLEKCLQSIIPQITEQDEILLMNDSSTDESTKICEEYSKKDIISVLGKEYISKNKIKQLVGYEENEYVSIDEIISLLKTMWEEFNRLEDIEDKMFTKYISKDIIRDKIKELAKQHDIEKDMYKRFDIEAQIEVLEEILGE